MKIFPRDLPYVAVADPWAKTINNRYVLDRTCSDMELTENTGKHGAIITTYSTISYYDVKLLSTPHIRRYLKQMKFHSRLNDRFHTNISNTITSLGVYKKLYKQHRYQD